MSEVSHETRSTIILFIAILLAVIITVWLILSFFRPNYKNNTSKQVGYYLPVNPGNYAYTFHNNNYI